MPEFAVLFALRSHPPSVVDFNRLFADFPDALAARILVALPQATAVASFQAIPDLCSAVRVGQKLRMLALHHATDEAIFRQLRSLFAENPARAMTLRRAMEWTADDAVFWPDISVWPENEADRAVEVALLAEARWDELRLPCVHRLPSPSQYPDTWPETAINIPNLVLPESFDVLTAEPIRAAVEWLHLWRLDAGLANEIRFGVEPDIFKSWVDALLAHTDSAQSHPLHHDIVVLEHLIERDNFLSQLEVDSLLRGVSDSSEEEQFFSPDHEGRQSIHRAILQWFERAGVECHD